MTYSLSPEAERFLQTEPTLSVAAVVSDPSIVPSAPGIYGWWFADSFLAGQADDIVNRVGSRLLYVGIAPSRAPKADQKGRTLRDRLKDHCCGPLRNSTLRRTLAALLAEENGFAITRLPTGKVIMSANDEGRLSAWMNNHAKIAYMVTEAPWTVESELLACGPSLPLNIKGSKSTFRHQLKALRRGPQFGVQ
jgi:hypothetical protein